MNTVKKLLSPLIISSIFMLRSICFADVVVIVHPDNPINALSKQEIANLFLGNLKNFPGGKLAIPVHLNNKNSLQKQFLSHILNRTVYQFKAHWARMVFVGTIEPPLELATPQEVKLYVANNSSAIGYVDEAFVDHSVKVVFKPL